MKIPKHFKKILKLIKLYNWFKSKNGFLMPLKMVLGKLARWIVGYSEKVKESPDSKTPL